MSHYQKFTPPFLIPDSWQWVKLEEITSKIGSGSTPRGSNYADKGIPFFRSQNVHNEGIVYEDIKYISPEIHSTMMGTEVMSLDLLLNITGGSIGRCAVIPAGFNKGNVSQHVCIIRPILIDSEYLHAYILSNLFWVSMKLTGSGREGLPKYNLEQMYLPLPPLTEQKRIVKAIANFLMMVSDIETNQMEMKDIISGAKSKILELAMQGKLVPQDPADEPAADMLRRVNPKARIITDNPHSRNLPNSWCEVRIIDLFHKMKREIPSGQKFKYIDIDSIDNKTNTAYPKEIEVAKAPSRASRHTKKDDIVFSMVRPYLRNIAKVPVEGCIASTGFFVFSPNDALDDDFAFQLLLSPMVVDGLNAFMKGDNSPSINKDNVENFVIPLPPLNEQKRIVDKINKSFESIGIIEASLQSR